MAKVYWAARDLSSFFWGNHQFLLVILEKDEAMQKAKTQEESGTKFVTIAGHQPNGNLVYVPNEPGDIASVKETLNKKLSGYVYNYSLEKHLISPPRGNGWDFAIQLEAMAEKYAVNTKAKPVKYSLANQNCSAWVNTLLKIAGISANARQTAGEFNGIDWGEEDLLDESLFK
jgi:hypothetical protein